MEYLPRGHYSAWPAGFGVIASGDAKSFMIANMYDTQMLAHVGCMKALFSVGLVGFRGVCLVMGVGDCRKGVRGRLYISLASLGRIERPLMRTVCFVQFAHWLSSCFRACATARFILVYWLDTSHSEKDGTSSGADIGDVFGL